MCNEVFSTGRYISFYHVGNLRLAKKYLERSVVINPWLRHCPSLIHGINRLDNRPLHVEGEDKGSDVIP